MLLKHFHPTVRKYAQILLSKNTLIEYKGNSLMDYTLANFLDRFSLKKPKKRETQGILSLKAKGKIRRSKIEEALSVDAVGLGDMNFYYLR